MMNRKKLTGPIAVVGLGMLVGLVGALALLLIGSVLISNSLLPQNYDFIPAAIALIVWELISVIIIMKRSQLKKWFVLLFTSGGIVGVTLVGNLLLPQPDLALFGANILVILSCSVILLLATGRKRKTYRIR